MFFLSFLIIDITSSRGLLVDELPAFCERSLCKCLLQHPSRCMTILSHNFNYLDVVLPASEEM